MIQMCSLRGTSTTYHLNKGEQCSRLKQQASCQESDIIDLKIFSINVNENGVKSLF